MRRRCSAWHCGMPGAGPVTSGSSSHTSGRPVPDAPNGRCFVAPDLPEWLSGLALQDLPVGRGRLSISLTRRGSSTQIDELRAEDIEVSEGVPEAPLWGSPPHLR